MFDGPIADEALLLKQLAQQLIHLLLGEVQCPAQFGIGDLAASGVDEVEGALRLIGETQGAQGAEVITPQGRTVIPAARLASGAVVDPTGAGDGFAAGLLAGLVWGFSPVESAQLGAVIASYVLEAVGCQTNLPDRAALAGRYRANFGEFPGGI